MEESRLTRELEILKKDEKGYMTPSKFFGLIGLLKLLRYCNVQSTNNLPEFWNEIARSPKSQHLNIFRWAVNRTSKEVYEPGLEFIVTASLVEAVKSLHSATVNM